MFNKTIALSLFLIITQLWSPTFAQETMRYSLVEDHQFLYTSDLYGYQFIPSEGKMSTAHYADEIDAGVVIFKMFRGYIIVDERARYTPGGIVGPPTDAKPYELHIEKINTTNYGYDIKLIDPENEELQGYLKLIKDGLSRIDIIKFRPSMADAEHTYFVQHTSKEQLDADSKFFTHDEDLTVKTTEELWGKTLYPFLRIDNYSNLDARKVRRIFKEDEVIVKFEERKIERGKKEKILQYIIFHQHDDVKRELLVKKTREIDLGENSSSKKALELQVRDEVRQEDHFIILHRGVRSWLRYIELQDGQTRRSLLYYKMRKGKTVIE